MGIGFVFSGAAEAVTRGYHLFGRVVNGIVLTAIVACAARGNGGDAGLRCLKRFFGRPCGSTGRFRFQRRFRLSTLRMFEKSSVHNGVDCGIAGVIQRASLASDPRSVAFLAITIHSDDKGPDVIV